MDLNEFLSKTLENQRTANSLLERIAEGVEDLVAKGVHVTNFTLPENFELKAVGDIVHATGEAAAATDEGEAEAKAKAEAEAKAKAKKKAEAEAKAKAEAEAEAKAKAEAEAEAEAEAKAKAKAEAEPSSKKYTADDARKALKTFAAIEGNEAAMALLESLGVASVSELAEKGSDAIGELIEKVGK